MRKPKAFTLLEIIISMAIILVAMGAIFMAFSAALKLFVDESTRTDVFIEADRGISRMTKELIGAKEIINSSSREVAFWLDDANGNGVRDPGETVTFIWSGATGSSLNREASGEVQPLAYGVYDFNLSYDNPSAPSFVEIKLMVGKGTIYTTIESSLKLRNI